jgi:hypothetical protein
VVLDAFQHCPFCLIIPPISAKATAGAATISVVRAAAATIERITTLLGVGTIKMIVKNI